MTRVLLNCLMITADQVCAGWSTSDIIFFAVRHLQEKSREQHRPLYAAFIDLTKVFDRASSIFLKGLAVLQNSEASFTHFVLTCRLWCNGMVSYQRFQIKKGVPQGCMLIPSFFGVSFSLLLQSTLHKYNHSMLFLSRSDGGLFNSRRMHGKTKVRSWKLHQWKSRDLLYDDNIALIGNGE